MFPLWLDSKNWRLPLPQLIDKYMITGSTLPPRTAFFVQPLEVGFGSIFWRSMTRKSSS
jgi:hypothetical protein